MELLELLTTPQLTLWQIPMSAGDLLGFISGLLCVYLTARANIWNFPTGILNSAILGLVFLQQRLFADAGLQIVFIALSIRGWHEWLSGKQSHEHSPVNICSKRTLLNLSIAAVLMTLVLWQILLWLKGSAPIIDAFITSLSLCAQWLLNKRALQTWVWWISVDLISIPLYWSRDLPLIALLYVIFLAICIQGWRHWKQLAYTAGKQNGQ